MTLGMVTDTGLSVVYEPDAPLTPIVECVLSVPHARQSLMPTHSDSIVFVHGLQGHPRGTWTKRKVPKSLQGTKPPEPAPLPQPDERKTKRRSLAWISKKLKRRPSTITTGTDGGRSIDHESPDHSAILSVHRSSRNTTNISTTAAEGNTEGLFWPADLLPEKCPQARILVFGYDTRITNYGAASTNKNSIYSHAKDLLFALSRETEGCVGPSGTQRPVVFVAHSLGGIVVKEMLSRSSTSTESHHTRIVSSTIGVIFLGTPHRGSPDFAAAGDWARTFASFFGAETSPTILHALGLKTSDLERAQEAFSALWLKHNFRVKTFQEGLGLTGINLGGLGNKVVPDYSSSLGDQREHAETIQANHRDICRFSGPDDPGYRQVAGELRVIYSTVEKVTRTSDACGIPTTIPPPSTVSSTRNRSARVKPRIPISVDSFELWGIDNGPLTADEKAFLEALWYPRMHSRKRAVAVAAEGTCGWLYENEIYTKWVSGESRQVHNGLLQIRGTPGSGKSVLVKETYRRSLRQHTQPGSCIAAFFFNKNGGELEQSIRGLFRSLLYQLLPQDREYFSKIAKKFAWDLGVFNQPGNDQIHDPSTFDAEELENILRSFLLGRPTHSGLGRTTGTTIFIDALDECVDLKGRGALSYFLGTVAVLATRTGVNLNIFMANRNFPHLTIASNPSHLDLNQLNGNDISIYVQHRLTLGLSVPDSHRYWDDVFKAILEKSRGVFLWVVLAVDGVIERWQQGASPHELLGHLDNLPQELNDMFTELVRSVPEESKEVTLKVFQWAIFSNRPLQLREWHDVFAFISHPTVPTSLKQCQESSNFTATDDQLERKIRALSKGLLEVAVDTEEPEQGVRAGSLSQFAGAGSFMMNPGETRVIRAIHESVNEYFKSSRGFEDLAGHDKFLGSKKNRTNGQIVIMSTCLDYLEISELDALVHARIIAAKREGYVAKRRASMMVEWRPLGEVTRANRVDERGDGAHEGVYESPIGPAGLDIELWLSGVVPGGPSNDLGQTITHTDENDPPAAVPAKTLSQFSVQSQRLETYPALLNYATDEFLEHAMLCLDDCDFECPLWDPAMNEMERIMKRLNESNLYRRWLALREELNFIYPASNKPAVPLSDYLTKIDSRFRLLLPRIGAGTSRAPKSPTTNHHPAPSLARSVDVERGGLWRRLNLPANRNRSKLDRWRIKRPLSDSDAFGNLKPDAELFYKQHKRKGKHPGKTEERDDGQIPNRRLKRHFSEPILLRRKESTESLDSSAAGSNKSRRLPREWPALEPLELPQLSGSVDSDRSEYRDYSPLYRTELYGLQRRDSVGSFRSAVSGGSRHSRFEA